MNKKTKVSIIIPVYNTAKYLSECLDSVINQTLKDIEIICVDDGSEDNSVEILNQYAQKDDRITVLTQKHKKQGAARNLGMSIAKGEYIGFVDSDDWCELDMFEKLYQRAFYTNSDITMCKVDLYKNSKKIERFDDYEKLKCFKELFFEKCFSPFETKEFVFSICVFPCNKVFKKSFIESNNLKFIENIYYEDGIFFLDTWFKANRITLLRDCLYNYRTFSSVSTCYTNDLNKFDGIKTLKYKEKVLRENNVHEELKEKFHEFKIHSYLYWYGLIQNKAVKFLYFLVMLFSMPACIIRMIYFKYKDISFYLRLLCINNKKTAFWGASLYLEYILEKYKIQNKNIVGIIDKNPQKEGTCICGYKCFSPQQIKNMQIEEIIIPIMHNVQKNSNNIKNYLSENNHSNIKVVVIGNIYDKAKDEK